MTEVERSVHNERVKLRATMLNTIGVAVIVTGLIVPFINLIYSGQGPKNSLLALTALLWVALGVVAHQLGARHLGRLK